MNFQQNREETFPCPEDALSRLAALKSTQVQQAIVSSFGEAFYALALTGTDLSAWTA